jgi:hypothetical protein
MPPSRVLKHSRHIDDPRGLFWIQRGLRDPAPPRGFTDCERLAVSRHLPPQRPERLRLLRLAAIQLLVFRVFAADDRHAGRDLVVGEYDRVPAPGLLPYRRWRQRRLIVDPDVPEAKRLALLLAPEAQERPLLGREQIARHFRGLPRVFELRAQARIDQEIANGPRLLSPQLPRRWRGHLDLMGSLSSENKPTI